MKNELSSDAAKTSDDLYNELMLLIRAVEHLTGAAVSVSSFALFFGTKNTFEKSDIAVSHHDCHFCALNRSVPGGRVLCIQNDWELRAKLARVYRKPFWQSCHAGMQELIIPLFYHEALIALFNIGQVQFIGQDWQPNIQTLNLIDINLKEIEHAYFALPKANKELFEHAGQLLFFALQQWMYGYPKALLHNTLLLEKDSIVNRASRVVHQHIEQNITASSIAQSLFISSSTLNKLFKKERGISLRHYIDITRYQLICRLLCDASQSLSSISTNVGFADDVTFTRWFRRHGGMSPSDYRENRLSEGKAATLEPIERRGNYTRYVQQYIQENFTTKVSVDKIARDLHITPDYLAKVFRQQTNETITQYLWHVRMEAVCSALIETDLSIRYIAQSNGFSSPSALSKRFRETFGIEPSEYRRVEKLKEGNQAKD